MDVSALVEIIGVDKTFELPGRWPWSPRRRVPAVRGVQLSVGEGEIVALVGQSGSGKTTLARMVLGLEEPSAGEIRLEGRRWSHLPERERQPLRLRYQYVPQDPMSALDPQQTPLEAVSETLRALAGRPAAVARTEAVGVLERLGLGARLGALPRDLSGGEQRRVTLARVLALSPRLIVADEPTSGLEPDRRQAVLRDLFGNLPAGAGCILVTHDMSAARAWAHRALVMLAGRVIEEVDLRADEPVHPYASLLFDPWSRPAPRGELAAAGCPFRPDCPLAAADPALAARCAAGVPGLSPVPSRAGRPHAVACFNDFSQGEA